MTPIQLCDIVLDDCRKWESDYTTDLNNNEQ